MIGTLVGLLVKSAIHAIPTLLGFGTMMGTDKVMKYGAHEQVGPWVIKGMNALQRTTMVDVINETLKQPESVERNVTFMHHQMQIIAHCARNRLGYILFDPTNEKHLEKLASYPVEHLDSAFNTACRLSGLEYLQAKPADAEKLKSKPAGPVPFAQEDDGLDWPAEDEESNPNP